MNNSFSSFHSLFLKSKHKLLGLLVFIGFFMGCEQSNQLNDTIPEKNSPEYQKALTLFFRGTAAMEINRYDQAEKDFKELQTVAPGEPAGWANLGLIKIRQGVDEEGFSLLERALKISPQADKLLYLLGNYWILKGDNKQAVKYWQQALQANPHNHKSRYALLKLELQEEALKFELIQQRIKDLEVALPHNLLVGLVRLEWSIKKWSLLEMNTHDILTYLKKLPFIEESSLTRAQLEQALVENKQTEATLNFQKFTNTLKQSHLYQQGLEEVQDPIEIIGHPLLKTLKLELPSSPTTPADTNLSFERKQPHNNIVGVKGMLPYYHSHDSGSSAITVADSGSNSIGAKMSPPPPIYSDRIHELWIPLDFNYDFVSDLVGLQNGQLKFWEGTNEGTFKGVDSLFGGKLPGKASEYKGIWTYDHELDGDLDLLVSPANQTPHLIVKGNVFAHVKASPFPWSIGVKDFVYVDLNGDGRGDAGIIDYLGKVQIYFNQGGGVYKKAPEAPLSTPIVSLNTADLNHNSYLELLTLDTLGTLLSLEYSHTENNWQVNKVLTAHPMFMPPSVKPKIFLGDLDNNTQLDIILVDSVGSHIWLAQGTEYIKQNHLPLKTYSLEDFNNDGKLDLWGLENGQEVQYIQNKTNDNHYQIIKIQTKSAKGDRRINSFGTNSEIEIRAGLHYQKQTVFRPWLHFGLGTQGQMDVTRILWPNGSVQAEFDLKPDQTFFAKQRLKGSCPWVFGYNGTEMAFIKDFLWRSPLGLKINAQVTAHITETEDRVKILGNQLKPVQGNYKLNVTAELWESHFIDKISLIEVDHPIGTEIFVDERFARKAPSLKTVLTGPIHPILSASNLKGKDVTNLVISRDDQFLGEFGLGPYQGLASENGVILKLNLKALKAMNSKGLLVARGWVYPTDSSINVALGQGHPHRPRGIKVEYKDMQGQWQVLHQDMGFPAGKCKTILIPLEGLPTTAQPELRLTTNMEVYWDSFHIAQRLEDKDLRETELLPQLANLHYRGFSEFQQRKGENPEIPKYQIRGTAQEWRDLEGFHTRFGDVKPLLEKVEDKYVIMNAGDEMSLEFPASPAPPEGYTRDYVLVADGWTKDGDYNTVDSKTVAPLPKHEGLRASPATTTEDSYSFQTRYVDHRKFQEALVVKK